MGIGGDVLMLAMGSQHI